MSRIGEKIYILKKRGSKRGRNRKRQRQMKEKARKNKIFEKKIISIKRLDLFLNYLSEVKWVTTKYSIFIYKL